MRKTKDQEIREVAAKLDALLDELGQAVAGLNAVVDGAYPDEMPPQGVPAP